MNLDVNKFCSLSTNHKVHQWLIDNDQDLYNELVEHLKLGKSCGDNKAKMIDILDKISDNVELYRKFVIFINNYFRYLVINDHDNNIDDNVDKIFKHYNPRLNTIPRRLIITTSEAISEGLNLKDKVNIFCSKQLKCEKKFIGDRCYIEYLPPEFFDVFVPHKNWTLLNK